MDFRIVITLADGAEDERLVVTDERGDRIEVVCAILARALVMKTREMKDLGMPDGLLARRMRLAGFLAVMQTLAEVYDFLGLKEPLRHDDPAAY